MRIIGCDLHAAQQTIAMLDCETGERIERTLRHEGSVGISTPAWRRRWSWGLKRPDPWGGFSD
jgi:hypothetical protein